MVFEFFADGEGETDQAGGHDDQRQRPGARKCHDEDSTSRTEQAMIIVRVDSVRDPVENDWCGSQNAKSWLDCKW